MENTILIVGVENTAANNHYIIDINGSTMVNKRTIDGPFNPKDYGYDVEEYVDFRTSYGDVICVNEEISKKYVEDLGDYRICIHHVDGSNEVFTLDKTDINEMLIKDYTFRRPSPVNPIGQISYKSKFDHVIKSFQEVIPGEKIHIEPATLFVVNDDHFIGVTISIFSNKTGLHLTMEYPLESLNNDDTDFQIEKVSYCEPLVSEFETGEPSIEIITLKKFHDMIMEKVRSTERDIEGLEEAVQSIGYYNSFFVVPK